MSDPIGHSLTVHVSPHGDDRASGIAAAPLRSLTVARDRLRADRGDQPGRMLLHGGDYWDRQLKLTPADNGLTIEAAPDEAPILYGGQRVQGWQPDGGPLFAAFLPGVAEGERDFRTLVVDGEFVPRARLPEHGRYWHKNAFDVPWMSTTGGGWQRQPTEEELTALHYTGDDLGDWLDCRNAEIQVFHQWDDSLVGVASVDADERLVRFRSPCGHPPGAFASDRNAKAHQYIVWNVREGMLRPGQWYLDRTRGCVVYWPRPDEDLETAVVLAPRHRQVIAMQGSEEAPLRDISIRDLELALTSTPLGSAGFGAGALDGVVDILGPAENIELGHLRIRLAGGKGISVRPNGEHGTCCQVRIGSCRVETCGGPGIHLRGESCEIRGCTIQEVGLTYASSLALAAGGKANLVAENRVAGCPYTAITAGGTGNRIEHNTITDFMRELDDGAAIYCFAFCDSIMRGNVVLGSHGRVASAYYLDETSRGSTVAENVAIDSRWPSHNHMAEACEVRNNVFVDSGDQLVTLARCQNFVFRENVFICAGDFTLRGARDSVSAWANNLFRVEGKMQAKWLDDYTAQSAEPWTPRDGSISGGDPFENTVAGDYRLRPQSAAVELGIPPLPDRVLGLAQRALAEFRPLVLGGFDA